MKTTNKLVALFLMALACISCVFAATPAEEAKAAHTKDLTARYGRIECKANLAVAQADNIGQYVEVPGIDENKDKVESGLQSLKDSAQDADKKGFQSAMLELRETIKALHDSVISVKSEIKNLSKADKKALKDAWKESVSEFASCNNNANKAIVEARISEINAQTKKMQATIDNLKKKGADSASLEAIVTDANEITDLLNQALDETNETAFAAKVNEAKEANLHIWARFQIERFDIQIKKLEQRPLDETQTESLAEIKDKLAETQDMVKIGEKYEKGEFELVVANLREIAQELNALAKPAKKQIGNQTRR